MIKSEICGHYMSILGKWPTHQTLIGLPGFTYKHPRRNFTNCHLGINDDNNCEFASFNINKSN